MQKKFAGKRIAAFILTAVLLLTVAVPAAADRTASVEDPETGIAVSGDFSSAAVLLSRCEVVQDNPLCLFRMNLSVWDSTGDYEGADYDTYYGACTVSVPWPDADCRIIGFGGYDEESNPIDPYEVPSVYENGRYVFTAEECVEGEYWLTALPDEVGRVPDEYAYQVLTDAATGITVTGVYPKGARLLAVRMRDDNKEEWVEETHEPYVTWSDVKPMGPWPFDSAMYDLSVYCGFCFVQPRGDLLVTVPHEGDGVAVLLEMTMEEIRNLTDEEDDGAINWYDRRWYDMAPAYKDGVFSFLTARLGTFLVAEQGYLDYFGGGESRGTPPQQQGLKMPSPDDADPENPPTGENAPLASAAGLCVLMAAAYVITKKFHDGVTA